MEDDAFFGPSWIDKQVDFEQPQPSTWKIVEKQREEVHLLTSNDLKRRGGPKISYVRASFLCQSLQSGMRSFLRVYMQIPHAGTKMEPARVRGSQAGKRDHDEVIAYQRFSQKRAQYMPKYLGHKLEFQPQDSMLVPGGYVEYILWEKLPGVHLRCQEFWGLTATERDDIFDPFNPAYKQVAEPPTSIPSSLPRLVQRAVSTRCQTFVLRTEAHALG